MQQHSNEELEVEYCYKRILNHWSHSDGNSLAQTRSNINSKLRNHSECFNLALILEQNEQYDTALKLYFDAWRYNPSSVEYQETFEKCIKLKLSIDVHNEQCYYLYAVFLKNQHRYRSALTVYKILTLLAPSNDGYIYSFGGLYYELNDNVKYQRLIIKAMQLSPSNAIYYHDYAYYLRLRANAFKLSQKYFLIAIKLSHASNELYIRNFICLLKALNKFKMALFYMDTILHLVNSNNELSINLLHARLMIDVRNLHKARAIYESLIKKYQHNWKVHSCFGTFLILVLDFKNAEFHYKESLNKCYNPRNLFNYICLMHSMNRYKECIKYLLQLSIKCNLRIHKEHSIKIQAMENEEHTSDESMFFCRGAQNLGEIPSKEQIEKLSAECYEIYARLMLYFNKYARSENYFKMSLKLDQQNEVAFGGYMLLKMELHSYESVEYLYDKGLFYINRYLPNQRLFLLHISYVYALCHKLRYGKDSSKNDDISSLDELFQEIEDKNKEKIIPEPVDIDIEEIGVHIEENEYDLIMDEKESEQSENVFVFIDAVRDYNHCLNTEEIESLCHIMNKWFDESNEKIYGRLLSVDKHYLHNYCGLSLLFANGFLVMDHKINDEDNKYLVLNQCKYQLEKALFYRPFCVQSLCCLYLVVCYLKTMNELKDNKQKQDNKRYMYQSEYDLMQKGKQINSKLFTMYQQKFSSLLQ